MRRHCEASATIVHVSVAERMARVTEARETRDDTDRFMMLNYLVKFESVSSDTLCVIDSREYENLTSSSNLICDAVLV